MTGARTWLVRFCDHGRVHRPHRNAPLRRTRCAPPLPASRAHVDALPSLAPLATVMIVGCRAERPATFATGKRSGEEVARAEHHPMAEGHPREYVSRRRAKPSWARVQARSLTIRSPSSWRSDPLTHRRLRWVQLSPQFVRARCRPQTTLPMYITFVRIDRTEDRAHVRCW